MQRKSELKSTSANAPLVVLGYQQLGGRQSEAGALRNVLAHLGVIAAHTGEPFTEALLFGTGGGIGLGYFVYLSRDSASLFIGTRITTQEKARLGFLPTICERIGVKVIFQNASGVSAAEAKLKQALADGFPVIVWVGPDQLPYYGTPAAYHTLVVYGFDEGRSAVHIADRCPQPLILTPAQLRAARLSETMNRFRALIVTPPPRTTLDVREAVKQGIHDCWVQMQEGFGPKNFKSNFGLKTLEKWATLLTDPKDKRGWHKFLAAKGWRAPGSPQPQTPRLYQALLSAYDQIENRGSGGSAFRPLYADFLVEAGVALGQPKFNAAAEQFRESARRWGELSAALLPDSVPLLKEARQLADKKRALFEKKGLAARDETQAINARLAEIKSQVEEAFPMSEAEVQDLLAGLRERVLAIHAIEEKAVGALQVLVK